MAAFSCLVIASMACAPTRQIVRGDGPVRRPERTLIPESIHVDPIHFEDEQEFAFIDGNEGVQLSFDDVLIRARQAQVVVVGEQHDQATHHEVQRRIVDALAADGAGLVVGLEMVPWTLQPVLDRFNAGAIDIDALESALDWSKTWGFSFDLYRPIFADGHEAGARFVALNAPRELVRAVRKKGLDGLSDDELRSLPDLDLGDRLHRAWFEQMFADNGHALGEGEADGFYLAQVTWDETMADRATLALSQGARQVVVLVGVGHIARGRGVPQRIERRLPNARVLSIAPLSELDVDEAEIHLKNAIMNGEGDVLVVPRFEDVLRL